MLFTAIIKEINIIKEKKRKENLLSYLKLNMKENSFTTVDNLLIKYLDFEIKKEIL